jgi:hypothetical protein
LKSLIATNHASWMQDHLATLGARPLSQLVLPASHDAAMYRGGILGGGQTQCLTIYEQLADGIRWFDLRPKWANGKFVIHHGAIDGPDFSDVLEDVKKFASKGHHELILIKLSHFDGIDDAAYARLAAMVNDELGPWLVKDLPSAKPLARVTLSESRISTACPPTSFQNSTDSKANARTVQPIATYSCCRGLLHPSIKFGPRRSRPSEI